MTVGVVVPAAGAGVRMGPGAPKALRLLAGEPVLVHAVRGLREASDVDVVVVAAPADSLAEVAGLLSAYDVVVVAGGATRQESVAAALAALPERVDLVLVHDAARCLAPPDVVERVVAALRAGADAVVPVLPVVDTMKRVAGEVVVETVDRTELRVVQTPQGFQRSVLVAAHLAHVAGDETATDDASLVERSGARVVVVAGSEEAFKVTRAMDLLLAEFVLSGRR